MCHIIPQELRKTGCPFLLQIGCTGFGRDIVNFLQSSRYWSLFWICAENRVDDRGMFQVFSSAYIESMSFLLLTPYKQQVERAQLVDGGHSQERQTDPN